MKPVIALQLYTLRDLLQQDMLGTLEKVADLGYQGVEMAGYGNSNRADVIDKLRELGLRVVGNHVSIDALENDFGAVVNESRELGISHLAIPYLDASRCGSREKWVTNAAEFDEFGQKLREAGLQLCYHNHDFEFEEQYDGKSALEFLYEQTSPELLMAELDTYWVRKGGISPEFFIRSLSGRVPLLHIKDMGTDGNFAEVGEGTLNWPAIFAAAEAAGTRAYIVEQDVCPGDPLDSIEISIGNLRRMGKL